jgi:hypothetical protein
MLAKKKPKKQQEGLNQVKEKVEEVKEYYRGKRGKLIGGADRARLELCCSCKYNTKPCAGVIRGGAPCNFCARPGKKYCKWHKKNKGKNKGENKENKKKKENDAALLNAAGNKRESRKKDLALLKKLAVEYASLCQGKQASPDCKARLAEWKRVWNKMSPKDQEKARSIEAALDNAMQRSFAREASKKKAEEAMEKRAQKQAERKRKKEESEKKARKRKVDKEVASFLAETARAREREQKKKAREKEAEEAREKKRAMRDLNKWTKKVTGRLQRNIAELRAELATPKQSIEKEIDSIDLNGPGCLPKKFRLFAYQQVVSRVARPGGPVQRLLCVHRTGSGKTLTMIKTLEKYYLDKRSKVIVFPNDNLVQNFYHELVEKPNLYSDYIRTQFSAEEVKILEDGDKADRKLFLKTVEKVKEKLEMINELHKRGQPGYLYAPIRAISYTVMGGNSVFGDYPKRKPMFKLWEQKEKRNNPLDNCVIFADEVHNLISGFPGYLNNYLKLQSGLYTMQNSVFIGFTATPVVRGQQESGDLLMAIIIGKGKSEKKKPRYKAFENVARHILSKSDGKMPVMPKTQTRSWKGHVSYFYGQPDGSQGGGIMYPKYVARPCVEIEMSNNDILRSQYKERAKGYQDNGTNVKLDISKKLKAPVKQVFRVQKYCNIGWGTSDGRTVTEMPKFDEIAKAVVGRPEKSLVIIDQRHGLKQLVERIKDLLQEQQDLLQEQHEDGDAFCGKSGCYSLLFKTDDSDKKKNDKILKQFNSDDNKYGEKIKCLVIDAKTYSEGVSFYGVRRLHIANPALSYAQHLQQLGRVFRACRVVPPRAEEGKKRGKRTQEIEVLMYLTIDKVPDDNGELLFTADEYAMELQKKGRNAFAKQMLRFADNAIDKGRYDKFEGAFKLGSKDQQLCLAVNGSEYDPLNEINIREQAAREAAAKAAAVAKAAAAATAVADRAMRQKKREARNSLFFP